MLNYKVSGQGEPILLIHGLFGNLDNLASCGRQLERSGFKVIRIDVRNHGLSPSQDEMDYPAMATDVIQLLDHLKIPRVYLLGHSMGGKIAMALALTQPERVKGLIVADIAPVTYSAHHTQVFKGLDSLWQAKPQSRSEADKLLAEHVETLGVRQFLLKNLRWKQMLPEWQLRYPQVKAAYANILAWPFVESCYRGATLFIKGGNSDYITQAHFAAIAKQFPNAKAHIIQGAGHWLHAEKPESFNRAVLRFLNQ